MHLGGFNLVHAQGAFPFKAKKGEGNGSFPGCPFFRTRAKTLS